jgi:hypothetical protein
MDKRKIKVTKSTDGKTTISRNTFGSGYKKESILLQTSTVIDQGNTTDEIMRSHNDGFDPAKLINGIESTIMKFLKNKDLPTKDFNEGIPYSEGGEGFTFISLPSLLKQNHADIIGVVQASSCLFEINCCKDDLRRDDFKAGMAHALRLVTAFQRFTYSVLEPTISLGKSRQDKMINENTKLSNEEQYLCFQYFESLDRNEDGNRSLGKGERWKKTSEYASKEFGVKVSGQTIRKAYATK